MKLAGSSILTLQALGIAGYFLNILFLAGMMRGRVAGRKRSGAIFIPPLVICLLLLIHVRVISFHLYNIVKKLIIKRLWNEASASPGNAYPSTGTRE